MVTELELRIWAIIWRQTSGFLCENCSESGLPDSPIAEALAKFIEAEVARQVAEQMADEKANA